MQDGFDSISAAARDAYKTLGAVCLRGIFDDWIELLRDGVQRNHDDPGPYFSENVVDGDDGRFWANFFRV